MGTSPLSSYTSRAETPRPNADAECRWLPKTFRMRYFFKTEGTTA